MCFIAIVSAVRRVLVGTVWDCSRPSPGRPKTLVAALLLMASWGSRVGSAKGSELTQQVLEWGRRVLSRGP